MKLRHFFTTLTILFATVFMTITASAQCVLYCVNADDSFLYTIDPLTGRAEREGCLQTDGFMAGLAYYPGDDILYGITYGGNSDESNLYSIDYSTETITLIGRLTTPEMHALAYDPSSGLLYGAAADSYGDGIYTIDMNTGAATFVGYVGLFDRPSDIVYGLAVHPQTHVLYGVFSGISSTWGALVEINKSTGQGMLIGEWSHHIEGLTFHPVSNVLYGVDNRSSYLYTIDIHTAATTFIGRTRLGNALCLEFVTVGGEIEIVTVPDVIGLSQADAESEITAAGLDVGNITFAGSDTIPAGYVINQNPEPEAQAIMGSLVNLVISFGPAVDYFAEQFALSIGMFDLSYKSLLFTPVDSSYSCCISDISALPTDPSGGTSVSLGDDDYEHVYLSGQNNVWLYGSSYSSFYIGSNGYITFTQGDSAYFESYSEHFDTERISVLFDDLNPSSSGNVSYKQLSDRVVVTWSAVPEYSSSSTNTFQVEMYFDGSIRLSWLSVASNDSIVGLSAGLGEPEDFEPSDLSEYSQCGQ